MRITPEILERQWDNIHYTDGGFLQIDTQHPLTWYIGYQSISQRTLLLVSEAVIDPIESSKSMAVSRRRRETDNRWTLSFELLRNEQQSVFTIFCCDVIENSRSAKNEQEALSKVTSRYRQWCRLLESQRGGIMSESSQKGLFGELLFLEERISLYELPIVAVQGWSGPNGADQDFTYPDGWFEIKSIGLSAVCVSISSMQQLDCADDGELVIYRVDKVAPDKAGALSLNDLVHRINSRVETDCEALDLFRSKLGAYGYIDLQEYSLQKYFCSGKQRYRVDESFPRLTGENTPNAVISLQYDLDLPSLASWLKE